MTFTFPIFIKGVSALTDKENNTKEKDNEKQQEKDKEKARKEKELKVVMPEAEWATMPQKEFAQQPDYLIVFADFYIAQFNQRDLEIMNLYDTNSNMVDINHYLLNNIHFTRKELVKHVLQYHAKNFQNIIDEIAAKDGVEAEKMTSYKDWDNWYEDRRNKISASLS